MNPASPIRKLIKAASCGDLKGVNAAIDEGADPYSLNGKAAIETAISKGYLDILERLFDEISERIPPSPGGGLTRRGRQCLPRAHVSAAFPGSECSA